MKRNEFKGRLFHQNVKYRIALMTHKDKIKENDAFLKKLYARFRLWIIVRYRVRLFSLKASDTYTPKKDIPDVYYTDQLITF